MLTNSSMTHNPGHADEKHHTPNVQHAADLQRQGAVTVAILLGKKTWESSEKHYHN